MWLVWLNVSLLLTIDYVLSKERIHIPIGAVFSRSDDAAISALKYAFWSHQNTSSTFVAEVVEERLEWVDTYQISRAVCRLMKQGIYALVAPTTPQTYSILVSYSNNFQIPLISPSFPEVVPEHTPLFAVGIKPNTLRAVNDLITYYRWSSIIYLYQSDDGAEKLQRIFELGGSDRKLDIMGLRRITSADEAHLFLRKLDRNFPDKLKNIVMDVDSRLAREIIITHVRTLPWERNVYHFLLIEPVPEGFWNSQLTEFGRVNITGFRLLDPDRGLVRQFLTSWRSLNPRLWLGAGNRNIPVEAMLTYDGAELLLGTLTRIYDSQQHILKSNNKVGNGTKGTDCLQTPIKTWEHGPIVAQYLKQTYVPAGLTGSLKFDPNGQRKQVTLDIIETTPNDYVKAGNWSDMSGLMLVKSPYRPLPDKDSRISNKKKYVIVSLLSPPYLLTKIRTKRESLQKDQVEGFVKDLADYLSEEMNFDYDLHLLPDSEAGKYNATTGTWTGLIGELVKGTADLSIAPLTITAERESVIDFTKPFQTVGISLMMKKPEISAEIGPFFFLQAFSIEVWICIIVSHLVFSMLLFSLSKFTSPPDRVKNADSGLQDRLGLCANFWFVCSSSLFRSSGIYPKSPSSRLASIFWWFFTLILVVLYIANLATILIKDKTSQAYSFSYSSYPSTEYILQEAIRTGSPKLLVLKNSSTLEFFKNSAIKTYNSYWQKVKEEPELLINGYNEGVEKVRKGQGNVGLLLESSMNEYINFQEPCDTIMTSGFLDSSGYGIATKKGSPLKEELDYALLSLKEKGYLNMIYAKWWREGKCKDTKKYRKLSDLYHSSLTLHEISGLFYILIGGIVITLIIAMVEFIFRRKITLPRSEF
ncbi:glutamate receptor 1-like isoform X2 [Centruroides sculpturatus]|uniref:glutamate receptor 1-like isoform X2 n=1 Tax=Centruroides sculpturatus TaxID=218467 RepID=UPI000C6DF46A|nr:glutamate receptor 1-like isoform X2 [Centruroides sculpturatus]